MYVGYPGPTNRSPILRRFVIVPQFPSRQGVPLQNEMDGFLFLDEPQGQSAKARTREQLQRGLVGELDESIDKLNLGFLEKSFDGDRQNFLAQATSPKSGSQADRQHGPVSLDLVTNLSHRQPTSVGRRVKNGVGIFHLGAKPFRVLLPRDGLVPERCCPRLWIARPFPKYFTVRFQRPTQLQVGQESKHAVGASSVNQASPSLRLASPSFARIEQLSQLLSQGGNTCGGSVSQAAGEAFFFRRGGCAPLIFRQHQ